MKHELNHPAVASATILIVDDMAENLSVLGNILQDAGYTVKAATSGTQALRYAGELPQPALILLDIMMPEMDGYAVLSILRESDPLRDIPVIFLTALDDPGDIVKGLHAGAADYIAKPIQPEIVLARVATQLQAKLARDWLKSQNLFLNHQRELILDTANEGIFGIDSAGVINFHNPAAATLLGYDSGELGGRSVHALLVGSEPASAPGEDNPLQVVCSTGETLTRLARFTPLLSETGSVTGVLGCLVEADRAPGPDPLSPVHRLHAELSALRGTLRARFARNSVVAVGQAMRRVLVQVELAAQTGTSALLIGEPGTGREHLARVIHSTGPGKSQWFVPLDCRRLPAEELAGLLARLLHEVPTSRGPKAATSTGPGPGTLFLSAIVSMCAAPCAQDLRR